MKGRTAAAVRLRPGWPETGSVCAATSGPTRPIRLSRLVQCMGTNTLPRRCPGATTARAIIVPASVSTSTRAPAAMPAAAASSGWISQNGSGSCAISRALFAVRVMVCHWSRTRPVLRVRELAPAALTARGVGDEARAAVGGEEAAVGEERGRSGLRRGAAAIGPAPAHRRRASDKRAQAPMSKSRAALVVGGRQARRARERSSAGPA